MQAPEADAGTNRVETSATDKSPELTSWKEALRDDFERWLNTIELVPAEFEGSGDAIESEDGSEGRSGHSAVGRASGECRGIGGGEEIDENDDPDLYSFREQLVAANAESRKANRRTAEAISQWGQVLTRFEESLGPLRETTAQLAAAQPRASSLSRAHCLALVEVLDRMHRLARAFQSPPAAERSWWGGRASARVVDAWQQAWEKQRQGLAILAGHLEALLAKEGVRRIETGGQPFDPTVMMAVASETDSTRPAQTVLEELAAGYRWQDELLRPAQVKVSRMA